MIYTATSNLLMIQIAMIYTEFSGAIPAIASYPQPALWIQLLTAAPELYISRAGLQGVNMHSETQHMLH